MYVMHIVPLFPRLDWRGLLQRGSKQVCGGQVWGNQWQYILDLVFVEAREDCIFAKDGILELLRGTQERDQR